MRNFALIAALFLAGCASSGEGPAMLPSDLSGYGDYDALGLCVKDPGDIAEGNTVAIDVGGGIVVYDMERYCRNGFDPAGGVYKSVSGKSTVIYHFEEGREVMKETYVNGRISSRADRVAGNYREYFSDGSVKEYNGPEGFLAYYPNGNVFTKHKDIYTTYYGTDGKVILIEKDIVNPKGNTDRYRMTKMYYTAEGDLADGRFSIPCQRYPGLTCRNFGVKDGRLNGTHYTFNPSDDFSMGAILPVTVSYYISGIENRTYDIVVNENGGIESFESFYFGDSDYSFVKAYRGVGGRPALVQCKGAGDEVPIVGVSMMVMLEQLKKDPTRNPCTGE
ncbi:MAG: hypothetical protein LBO78_00170 [Rickettsiales bacterium]|jgi:hypothetical protein|nr:hypothetical protein [Rickettsiales bacterium]